MVKHRITLTFDADDVDKDTIKKMLSLAVANCSVNLNCDSIAINLDTSNSQSIPNEVKIPHIIRTPIEPQELLLFVSRRGRLNCVIEVPIGILGTHKDNEYVSKLILGIPNGLDDITYNFVGYDHQHSTLLANVTAVLR